METSKIGVRYAKAFFGLAKERNQTDAIANDVRFLMHAWNETEDLRTAMLNPVVPPTGKKKILKALFAGNVEEITMQFLNLVVQNRREAFLPDILRRYMFLYNKSLGIQPAELVTAVPVPAEISERVKNLLRDMFQSEIELTTDIQPAMIGGFILRIDDLQIDASVASRLRQLKRRLIE